MLQVIEINPEIPALASVIWLHGFGASGNDFVDIVPQLHLSRDMGVRFILPNAPTKTVKYAGNKKMRAWFDPVNLDRNVEEDVDGIRESERLIAELIGKELAQKIPSTKVVLAGFSQGGAMALQCGLRYPENLAGILVLSAWLPLAETVILEKNIANQQTPILMIHGTLDHTIPLNVALNGYNYLKEIGYPITLSSYQMQHTVCSEEINLIGDWLRNLI
jgi:Predicted esterase